MVKADTTPPQFIQKDRKVFKRLHVAGFRGYVPCEDPRPVIPEAEPSMVWEGGRINLDVWAQVMAFFEWSYKEFKSETQVRLYYNRTTQKWASWAYPQCPDGMTTKEAEDHPDLPRQRAQFPEPWMLLGTIHHHCSMSAFQSGTDSHNEQNQEGIHITVGGIGSAEYSLHSRLIVRNFQFNSVPWTGWFEMPKNAEEFPFELQKTILEYYLKRPPLEDTPFPEQWKTNCVKKVYKITSYPGSSGVHTTAGAAATVGPSSRTAVPVKTDLRAQFDTAELEFMKESLALMDLNQVSQNQADNIINTMTEKEMNGNDIAFSKEIRAVAAKHKIVEARLDQLLDCWDFQTVLNELFPPSLSPNERIVAA